MLILTKVFVVFFFLSFFSFFLISKSPPVCRYRLVDLTIIVRVVAHVMIILVGIERASRYN